MTLIDEQMIVVGVLVIMFAGLTTLFWSLISPETLEILMGILLTVTIGLVVFGVVKVWR